MNTLARLNLLRGASFLPMALVLSAASGLPAGLPRVMDSYGKLPLSFEANRGQADPRVRFLSRGRGYTVVLTDDGAVLSLDREKARTALRIKLGGARAPASVKGVNALPGRSNYFIGRDPSHWRTNVPTYAGVKYAGVYRGIDLVYHGNHRLLEYDFVVAPGADPRIIDIRFQGAGKLSVNRDGALVIGAGESEVVEHAPVVYQEIDGKRQQVAGSYVLRGHGRVGFSVPEYDHHHTLVIDPTLTYSTYLGGTDWEEVGQIAVDSTGNAFVVGTTQSFDFPTTPGALQPSSRDGQHVFVAKLNPTGSTLIFSTYLGGSRADYGYGIALDGSGDPYIAGSTSSSDFPTTPGAFQTSLRGEMGNSFVSKLNAAGSALVYSTYLGGSTIDSARAIAIDSSGNAYVTGATGSADFPTTKNGFQTALTGKDDPFVTKLNAAGSALVYSTYLGDGGDGRGIAVDASGSAVIVGTTSSLQFPVTPGAFQPTFGGRGSTSSTDFPDAFVSKLNASGSALVYSTYLGGNDEDVGNGIALDSAGNAFIVGFTQSTNFPTTAGALQVSGGGDAFVTKLNASGSALLYSTYLGGTNQEYGYGIAVDASGDAYVAGSTFSSDFPTTAGALPTPAGNYVTFISKVNPFGTALLYSTCLGGTGGQYTALIAIDSSGNAYVSGLTDSSDFPITPGAFQTTYAGNTDAYVSKLNLSSPGSASPFTAASVKGPTGSNSWYLGATTVTLAATPGSSPVSATYYSLDGGRYQGYGGPFTISTDGVHQLLYYSVDAAGNQETPHGQTIKVDATKPVSRVTGLPATAPSPNFSVQWSGADSTSGIADYSIYVSDNAGAFAPWLLHVNSTQASYSGSPLHTYAFYSAATDNAGNVEIKTAADTTTRVPQMPGDANGDGRIDCADVSIVKASFGKRAGQTGFDPRADINGDGVVDVRDLALVSQKLLPGTRCP